MSDYLMHADVSFSRRKRLHHIMDGTGQVCWSGALLVDALNYLVEAKVYEFRIEGHDDQPGFQVMIHRD